MGLIIEFIISARMNQRSHSIIKRLGVYAMFTFVVYKCMLVYPNWIVSESLYVDWNYDGFLEDTVSGMQPLPPKGIDVNVTKDNPLYATSRLTGKSETWPLYPKYSIPDRNVEKCDFPKQMFVEGRNSDSLCMETFIVLLNKMNITYFLDHKSALGAYRNNGNIPGDDTLIVGLYAYNNEHASGPLVNAYCSGTRGKYKYAPYLERGERSVDERLCGRPYRWWAIHWAPAVMKYNMLQLGYGKRWWRAENLEVHGSQPTSFEARYMCPNRPYGQKPLHILFWTKLYHPTGYDMCACQFGSVYAMCKKRTHDLLKKHYHNINGEARRGWTDTYPQPKSERFDLNALSVEPAALEWLRQWEVQEVEIKAEQVYNDRAANPGKKNIGLST
eukprot:CFRG8548T1